jgi:hypothetical protein
MSHFTIKWKARERGNYGCKKALDILSHKEKNRGRKNQSNWRLMGKYCISLILVRLHVDIFYPIIYKQRTYIQFIITDFRISCKTYIFHWKISIERCRTSLLFQCLQSNKNNTCLYDCVAWFRVLSFSTRSTKHTQNEKFEHRCDYNIEWTREEQNTNVRID